MNRPRFCLIVAAFLASAASLSAQSSVWKVTRDDGTLYLGGTCHTLRPSDLPIPEEYSIAFDAAATLVFETDIARMQSIGVQSKLMASLMFTDGTRLSSVLSPEAWTAVQDYCATAGMTPGSIEMFKPSMITVMVFALESQRLGFTPEGVDVQLDRRARAAGKAIEGLETIDEQIAFVSTLGAGQESELILSTLRDLARIPTLLDDMVAAWRAGDLERIDALMSEEVRREFPKIHEELLVKRNKAWLPRIEAMLASEPVEFVLVGVAHVAGDDGLIHALEQAGCTIEQLRAAK